MTTSHANPLQMRSFGEGKRIVPVEADRQPEAAARLVALGQGLDRSAGNRFLAFAQENRIPLDRFWAMEDDQGRFDAAVLAVPNPGRTSMIFASRPSPASRSAAIAALLEHACKRLEEDGLRLAQTLLEPRERAERRVFESGGFGFLATLSYLQRQTRSPLPDPPEWPTEASLETYDDSNHHDFLHALAASYIDTKDCPRLNGLREPEEILAGHRAAGKFEPGMWTLLRLKDDPAGVLLMNPSPRQESIELIYIGLGPEARRKGLGRRLLLHGLKRAAERPELAVSLAVDEQNAPAMRLYHDVGFRRLLRRIALIRPLKRPS